MEVILKENFPSLGYVGDVVRVRNGYARNFLIPRGVAFESTSHNAKLLKHLMAGVNVRRAKLKGEAEELGKKIAAISLAYTLKAGEGGKVFGSIQTKDIETSLLALGFQISRTQIKLNDAIKKAGEYTVSVKLHSEVIISVPVKVTSEAPKTRADSDAGAEKQKRRTKSKKGQEEGADGEAQVAAPDAESTPKSADAAGEGETKKPAKKKSKKSTDEGAASEKSKE